MRGPSLKTQNLIKVRLDTSTTQEPIHKASTTYLKVQIAQNMSKVNSSHYYPPILNHKPKTN